MIGTSWEEVDLRLRALFREHVGEYLDRDGRLDVSLGRVTTRNTCPVCGSMASCKPVEFIFFKIVRCGACGFRYMQSFPDTMVLQNAHGGVIKSQHPHRRAREPEAARVDDGAIQAKVGLLLGWFRDLERLVDLPSLARGTFLDIGAGGGYAAKAAEAYGFRRVMGIEFDPRHARFGRDRLNVEIVETPVEKIELPEDVSLIRMNHVLEHIERPVELLARCRAALATPGLLYVGVPNMRSLSVRLWSTRHRCFQPVHVNYFHARSLRAAVVAAGFPSARMLTDHLSLKALLSDPLAATHIGKYYLRGLRFDLWSRLGLRLMRRAGRVYPAALDRALIRLFPLWGDNLVCLAPTRGVSFRNWRARS